MKNWAKVIKTVIAGIAATALLPFGFLVAQAAPSDQYIVVRGYECVISLDKVSEYSYTNLSDDESTYAFKAPEQGKIFAYCGNGQGYVPATSSPDVVGRDFYQNPTDIDPFFSVDRMPALAAGEASAPAPAPEAAPKPASKPAPKAVKKTVKNTPTVVLESNAGSQAEKTQPAPRQATKTNRNERTQQAVNNNDGKVVDTVTTSVNNGAPVSEAATDTTASTSEENTGTVSRDVVSEATATANPTADTTETTSDNTVDGQQIEASDYAAANLSLVDRMGGAGTLIGIVILGLVGAAGAISLTRSIILG